MKVFYDITHFNVNIIFILARATLSIKENTDDIADFVGKVRKNSLDIGINAANITDNEEDVSVNAGEIDEWLSKKLCFWKVKMLHLMQKNENKKAAAPGFEPGTFGTKAGALPTIPLFYLENFAKSFKHFGEKFKP